MISVRDLSKRFGYRLALRQLNLEVKRGELVGLLGPNGAGKSTLLRLLATLARPTAGAIQIAGCRLPEQAIEARGQIGYVGHHTLLYDDLSAEQNLAFFARLYSVPNSTRRIAELLELFDLEHRRRDPLRTFSRGMQQRVALARAVLHKPRVLLLDEPHSALDLAAGKLLDELLHSEASRGTTVLFATHDLDRAARIAHRIEVMQEGELVRSFGKAGLRKGGLAADYARAVGGQRGR
jgi:heme exporter protein A